MKCQFNEACQTVWNISTMERLVMYEIQPGVICASSFRMRPKSARAPIRDRPLNQVTDQRLSSRTRITMK